ncbi:ABC transporter D family member 2, chloroplastic [Gracilariopsis chorda]|uniref:Probable ATP-dependent transporter ycf16 n=1 Tax=Gracilariopsis chorda TaxID=448386 RepID=A0A2V3J468_9FLOR|nr:ABC transporter D family member 2, chloroplastic [Gracilariopsis chorda]|eukprot:PXF48170.1 ABC transporter D family member 2, chloroplastic [Gracilariopsis chorda]
MSGDTLEPTSVAPNGDITAQREANLAKQRQDPRRLWFLFWTLAKPYWKYGPGAKTNVCWVVFLGLVRSGLSVVFSFISRDFWTALHKKDVPMFWRQITLFTVVLLSALPILVWYSYAKDRLALRWRKWYTEKVLGDYFAKRNYYEIDQSGTVDNPDQRIAEDIGSFTSTSLSFFMTVLLSIVDLVNFSLILVSIYPGLFFVLFAYSSVGTIITVLLGKRMINLNFLQLKKEADFRYSLIRVRENAESIAFYRGEDREKFEISRRFGAAFLNLIDLIVWSRNLAFFTTTYSYIIQILPLIIVAPMYFAGSLELGVLSQSQQAFGHILSDLSLIVNEFESLSAFSAGVDRLGEMEEFIYTRFGRDESLVGAKMGADEWSPTDSNADDGELDVYGESGASKEFAQLYGRDEAIARFRKLRLQNLQRRESTESTDLLNLEDGAVSTHINTTITPNGEAKVVVEDLTLKTPDRRHRTLFENVSFTLENGERLLIVGPSGTGKSSALRALAGLWTYGQGTVMRPKLEDMFFLPQKPYCTLGSLREQLVYPTPVAEAAASTAELETALQLVNLENLPSRVGGLEEVRDWSGILSLGEQQRLAFARLIVGKPKLAILDECSSALDTASEDRLYSHLQSIGIGYISVGHRPSLYRYHNLVLRLGSDEQTVSRIDDTPS